LTAKEPKSTRPDARKIIDTIVEAMREGTEPFDDAFNLVPSEFDVELHPDAYTELESIFPIIEERAGVRLDQELDLLNRSGGSLLGRMTAWLKRGNAQDTPEQATTARFKPAGYGWRIRFSMTLDLEAGLGYVAVIAQLAATQPSNLAGPKTRRLTIRGDDGQFKTRKLGDGERVTPSPAEPVSKTATAAHTGGATEETAPAGRALARLSFKDDDGPRTFTMNKTEIVVGRGDDDGYPIDLALRTLPDVSREHLRLRFEPTRKAFLIKDISSYGTTIDGRPVPPSIDKATREDCNHWEPIPTETTLGLAGVLFIDFKSLV